MWKRSGCRRTGRACIQGTLIRMGRGRVTESRYLRMAISTKESGCETKPMAKVNSGTRTAITTKVSGLMIRLTDRACTNQRMAPATWVSGKMICSMGMEKRNGPTSPTSKASIRKVQNMVRAFTTTRMVPYTTVTG